jgi:hypothetical protein
MAREVRDLYLSVSEPLAESAATQPKQSIKLLAWNTAWTSRLRALSGLSASFVGGVVITYDHVAMHATNRVYGAIGHHELTLDDFSTERFGVDKRIAFRDCSMKKRNNDEAKFCKVCISSRNILSCHVQ